MTFPLEGLLRVRGAQERVAAEELSRAGSERREAEAAQQQMTSSLADLGAQGGDPAALMAMAAARASARSALGDLQALTELRRREESEAKAAHIEARRELKGLERLESTHHARTVQTELAAEQTALDEVAVGAAHREGSAA